MTRLLLAVLIAIPVAVRAQPGSTGRLAGVVSDAANAPIIGAIIELRGAQRGAPRSAMADSLGRFLLDAVPAGLYELTARRVGFQPATLSAVRVSEGRTTELRVVLTQTAARLSTVQIVASATQVDVTTPAQVERLERRDMARLATGRDAASLVGLVPGARAGAVWGGGGDLSNNVQLDGVAAGHPGTGGDFLRPSVDWIDRLEVRGLGAGADEGNFQGGVINAVTRTGTDRREMTVRTNLEAARLAESNFNLREEGSEQASRREVSGEAAGPFIPGKLHYFFGGQAVARDWRVPDLTLSNTAVGYRRTQTALVEGRGLAKVTYRPSEAGRLDLLFGLGNAVTDREGLNGADDPSSTQRVSAPSRFYEVAWMWDRGAGHAFDLRLVGYSATEDRVGYEGRGVPGVRAFALAREPGYQNADFSERRDPSSLALKGSWRTEFRFLGVRHRLLSGAELNGGHWRQDRTRNGGLTWRPFPDPDVGFIDPADPSTWAATGTQWGGEVRLRSEVRSGALFLQDEFSLGSRLTVSPGIRASAWEGVLRAPSGLDPSVRATGWDPRVGLAWDVWGDGTTALKTHWGRYHQGMAAALFDRLAGADVYSNERFYTNAPRPNDPRSSLSPEDRDATYLDPTGAPLTPNVKRFDEAGRAAGYRQPYMDQLVVALERSFGQRWKVELVYTDRRNRNLVGLLDRNLASNFTPIRDVAVRTRYGSALLDPEGERLTLPLVWIPNNDLRDALITLQQRRLPAPPGFSYDTLATLTWNPDLAVTTLPDGRRTFRQAYVAVRTEQARWNAAGSFAWTQLEGNIAGVTAFGGAGDAFRAGGWARPNEAINNEGPLGDFAELEAKFWIGAQLPWGFQGGVTLTHLTGERITPFFEMEAFRYRFATSHLGGAVFEPELFQGANGQTLFLEPRGTRRYADRTLVDVRLERAFVLREQTLALTVELFNALAEDAATAVKLRVEDNFLGDPTTDYAAIRQRVAPRRVRLGMRIDF